jgi:hypothetical protein
VSDDDHIVVGSSESLDRRAGAANVPGLGVV